MSTNISRQYPQSQCQLQVLPAAHRTQDVDEHISLNTRADTAYTPDRGESISSIFSPHFALGLALPDITLVSSDRTHFHTHRQRLFSASSDAFGGLLLRQSALVPVPYPSHILTIVLHVIYGLSCPPPTPALDAIESAIGALKAYGVSVRPLASPSFPLYKLLTAHAPVRPLAAYALAGQHGLEDAAVAISAHLLAYEPWTLSDADAVKMGPVYLRRLLLLQQTRLAALKTIVLRPPRAVDHPPVAGCKHGQQLTQAWAFAAAQLAWDTLPCISTHALKATFEKAGLTIVCWDCRALLHARIQEVIQEWSSVKRTI